MAHPPGSAAEARGVRASTALAYTGLVACVATWGMVFVAVAELLPDVDALQIVSVRFVIVALACAALLAAAPALRPDLRRSEWRIVVLCGVLAVPGAQYFIVEAQNSLSPTLAALIVTFSPAVAAVLAAVFLRTRLGPAEIAGFVIALAGVVLVLVVGSGSGSVAGHSSVSGTALAVICPVAWGAYTLVVAPLVNRHHPIGVVCIVMIVGALALAPTYPHAIAGLGELDGADWAWLVALSVVGTVFPNVLWVASLRHLPVHRTSAFMYVVPLFATVWAALILGRVPDVIAIPGGALVLLGVYLTQGRAARGRPAAAEVKPL